MGTENNFIIEMVGVSRSFDVQKRFNAVDNVELKIEQGEIVSIVGPSGSGKSTLLNLIGGLDRPTAGSILIAGVNTCAASDDALTRLRRDKIGFIFQFFNLLPSLNCIQNVALPLRIKGCDKSAAERRAKEMLDFVQLAPRVTHLPDELSGGERQRVAIARALVSSPAIVLADEPTGNLDSHTSVEVLRLITNLRERFNTTVLIVTHDRTVAETCPRTVSLQDGRIVGDRKLSTALGSRSIG